MHICIGVSRTIVVNLHNPGDIAVCIREGELIAQLLHGFEIGGEMQLSSVAGNVPYYAPIDGSCWTIDQDGEWRCCDYQDEPYGPNRSDPSVAALDAVIVGKPKNCKKRKKPPKKTVKARIAEYNSQGRALGPELLKDFE